MRKRVRGQVNGAGALSRREFLRASSAGVSAAFLSGGLSGSEGVLGRWSGYGLGSDSPRNPLRLAPEADPRRLDILAAPGTADIGGGVQAPGWLLNGSLPSPLLRVQRGDAFDVTLTNRIPEHLILHWHGLTPPEEADGHPRLAVDGNGGRYHYGFRVENRAGTYWYHSHAHHRVAKHTQMGIAGMLIVEDDEEAALGLPSGAREIPLILQDRKLDAQGIPHYHDANVMEGHVGDEPFGNGVRRPYLDVDTALYRFRLLNGSNARIFRLELSDGTPLVLIGNDGGLIERPVPLAYLDLSPGERADVLIDFRRAPVGSRVMLRSVPFAVGGHVTEFGGENIHDINLNLLELRVAREVEDPAVVPGALVHVPLPDPAEAVRERTFKFSFQRDPFFRSMERHHLNGKMYEMDRIDERVPFGETEIWSFENVSWFAHPVHLHATHFRVLSADGRTGPGHALGSGASRTPC
jgi:FtsP/CotA-like multicopper oxidase with cupredoxin domain